MRTVESRNGMALLDTALNSHKMICEEQSRSSYELVHDATDME